MTIHYVRKDGDDSSGDGSSEAPWLTIDKGISMLAAGDTLLIGDGEYQENSGGNGYLSITRTFATPTRIGSESGDASKVTVMGSSSATYDTLVLANGGNLVFEDLTFAMRTNATANGALRVARGTNLAFMRCGFVAKSNPAGVRPGLYVINSGSYTVQDILFDHCAMSVIGNDQTYGTWVNIASGGVVQRIAFLDCKMSAPTYGLYVKGGADISVIGGEYHSPGSPALAMGADSEINTTTVSGWVDGARIRSDTSHGCLIGAGAVNVVVKNCVIHGGDLGLVAKECSGALFLNNTIYNGFNGSLYFKAAVNATARYNRIVNSAGGWCIRLSPGGTGNKCQNVTVTDNLIRAGGAAVLFGWGGDSADLGGGVCDRNRYTGAWGTVRGTTVTSLAGLRAAWAGYGDSSNDGNSGIWRRTRLPVF